jgi:hypothetical protein
VQCFFIISRENSWSSVAMTASNSGFAFLPYTIGAPVFLLKSGVLKQNQRENAFKNIFKFYIIAF